MQNFNRITIQRNKKSQKEPLENISKNSFLLEWTFLLESPHRNLRGTLEGIYFKNKWLPKFFSKKHSILFFTDDNGTYLKNSFSNNKNYFYVPFGEKIGIKFIKDNNVLNSIFSSTFSDEGMVEEIPLDKFNIPFKNIGTKLDQKSVKNIIIKTNKLFKK
jgi:hypothetical protein